MARPLHDDDPIAQLNRELLADGAPSLAWVMRWSVEGGDPVAAEWRASRDPIAMLRTWRMAGVGEQKNDRTAHPLRRALELASASLPRVIGTRGAAHRAEVRRAIAGTWSRLWTEAASAHLAILAHGLERWPIANAPLVEALHGAGPPTRVEPLIAREVALRW